MRSPDEQNELFQSPYEVDRPSPYAWVVPIAKAGGASLVLGWLATLWFMLLEGGLVMGVLKAPVPENGGISEVTTRIIYGGIVVGLLSVVAVLVCFLFIWRRAFRLMREAKRGEGRG